VKRRPSPVDWTAELDAYVAYLAVHRGLSDGGRGARGLLRRLVKFLVSRQVLSSAALTLADLDAWMAQLVDSGRVNGKTLTGYVSVVRGLLKYLHGEGLICRPLWTSLETPRLWQETTVPTHFSWAETAQLIASVSPDAPGGRRNVALLWLLASVGLRACEVARLTLPDVDWQQATVTLRDRKRGTPLVLPLLPVVAEALRSYVALERPATFAHEHLFLTDNGKPFSSGSAVSARVRELAAQAQLGNGRGGPALRRGLGVRLLETGAGLGQIALILGHQRPRSTRAYVRASLEQLREVADNYANLL
jgi:integrase/recombinase XerD